MAHYDYQCRECGKKFETEQTFAEHDRGEDHQHQRKLACPKCGSRKVEQRVNPSVFAITAKKS